MNKISNPKIEPCSNLAINMNRNHDIGSYEEFDEDGNSIAKDSLGGSSSSPPGSAPSSLDPGAHIEMSAAVSGVVPDGKPSFAYISCGMFLKCLIKLSL